MLSHCVLASIFLEKSVVDFTRLFLYMNLFFSCCFQDFLFVFDFQQLLLDVYGCEFLCIYSPWSSLNILALKINIFHRICTFLVIIFLSIFPAFLPLFSICDSLYVDVIVFNGALCFSDFLLIYHLNFLSHLSDGINSMNLQVCWFFLHQLK